MGPQIAYETLLGAMFAKIILPWILHLKFWIFADADGEQGADVVRIWALWLGLVVMLADSFFKILWSLWEAVRPLFQDKEILPPIQARPSMDSSTTPEAILIPTIDTDSRVVRTNTANTAVQSKSLSSIFPKPFLGLALIALTPVCIFALRQCIGKFFPWIEALVAISLALPLCYVSILATGRSDYTPASALGLYLPKMAHSRAYANPFRRPVFADFRCLLRFIVCSIRRDSEHRDGRSRRVRSMSGRDDDFQVEGRGSRRGGSKNAVLGSFTWVTCWGVSRKRGLSVSDGRAVCWFRSPFQFQNARGTHVPNDGKTGFEHWSP
jgi:hypothetical protein